MDNINLNSFLKFGYFLDYKNPNIIFDFSKIDKKKYEYASENELVEIGTKFWNDTIEQQFDINDKHVIPLSGGIDSRAILGTLLKFTEAKNIHTYTYGTPGTLDYDIGNLIAQKVGTNHTMMPLTNYKYELKGLISNSKRIDHQTLLFLHPDMALVDQLFADFSVWSGAIIDVFFGIHTHKKKASNFNDAVKNSFVENLFVKSIDLTNIKDEEYIKFIEYDKSTEGVLDYEHVIDILNRQLKYVAPHVLMKGYVYKTLLNEKLMNFALSINKEYIENQYLYIKMFLHAFPFLFSLPNKTCNGLSFNASKMSIYKQKVQRGINFIRRQTSAKYLNPRTNYIDFSAGIREREDLKDIIYGSLMDLKQRKIVEWIDIDKIWHDHLNRKANYYDALITLTSLEIHFKAGKRI